MLPPAQPWLHSFDLPCRTWRLNAAAMALTLLALPGQARAQDAPDAVQPAVTGATNDGPIGFEADGVSYDSNGDTVTAFGNVILRRGDQSMRADQVVWNRSTGKILATGNIRFVDPDGNQLFSESLELTDEFKTGAMDNMLLALREGGRLAALKGERGEDGRIYLTNAAYSACAVEDSDGCPKNPSWRITSQRVIYDPEKKQVRFTGARLELFGAKLLPLPGLVLATDGRPINGLLIPDVRYSSSNGIELVNTWYQRLAPDKDLALSGYVYTKAAPMLSGTYRQLASKGAFQITGYATYGSRIPIGSALPTSQKDFRGYFSANGKFQFDPNWSLTFSGRVASDRTFLRRYDISRDDRLRSMIDLEHIDANSYLSLAGWATQTLRVGDSQGQVPVALPVLDYRRRLADPVLGGKVELQLNSLAITRTSGQDTQRAFASARWDMRKLTPWGQEVTFTALARGDVYHTDETGLTSTAIYRGNPGWEARGIATAAMDVKWPLTGAFLGGNQVLTPRFQVVASPALANLSVPNEDARAIDLEDSNLFALNRFPGYDRVEDGVRFTYGLDWFWERPDWRINATIGQTYRLTSRPTLFPDGTGLSNRVSDVVGRTEIRFKDFVKFTHRYRLDKDNLAVRRNEFDATVGTSRTYAEVGYLRLNRNISSAIEDLRDREEVRFAGRVGFARYWSIFGSGVVDLTSTNEDPTAVGADGFQPVRTRLGVAYQDDCIDLDFTWRRDYVATGDARKGNTFEVHFALRNLGFR
ncbi:LPS-assembly protein LptD [Novosphingobium aquiterrae]|uniref:LPS-assembly protein LptD n=1 Tax=Novosphingobium aquiterrae TaxID=624388 RepID=A0ABV6PE85_9SPHN